MSAPPTGRTPGEPMPSKSQLQAAFVAHLSPELASSSREGVHTLTAQQRRARLGALADALTPSPPLNRAERRSQRRSA